uniref:Similar to n=1 Tax=Caenorhabditis tropicalis TaxID=1561998 RepID=A0A1I7UF70_9PELO
MSSLRQSSATSPTSPVARNVYSRGTVDVETGEVHQTTSHKRPYTPGASPREILAHQQSLRQLPSPSQISPHGSRFMDGYRRRMRQASLNLPSETQLLDEDLGFPPVCSPPPEVFCGSISGNQRRNRSNSEAHPSMRMRSSHSLGNGSGVGGLLVFFPTSPSSSSNNSGGHLMHRRESHTDETAEEAIVWSNDISDDTNEDDSMNVDDVSMKDVEMASPGVGGKSLKRPPDLGG